MHALDQLLTDEIKATARKLDELWALLEEPPEGVDVAANVESYVHTATEDEILATGLYLKALLEPAIEAATRERARVLKIKQANEAQRKWMRGLLAEMLDRLGQDKVKGALCTVSRTAGHWQVERDPAVDLSLVPERFLKPREPAIEAIEQALRRGEKVPGFRRVQVPGVQVR
jgi:hypothetical protein